ncbi:4'-phosphopantetheinyl transferase family protein [Salinisphaera hydrothermalis]|uniref:4'-phosphopantetheinyl transferase family protein n=1 Tax=Salinisphaera hydrothermalis TaxID=563188 RepID=UPI00334198A2
MTRLSLAVLVFDDTIDPNDLRAGLSDTERDHEARIVHAGRRREYLGSRWLLRYHLAGEYSIKPKALAIEYPAGTAPRCAHAPGYLGLSHSGTVGLSVLASAPAGCDIEQIRARRFTPERLAGHSYHPDEVAELQRVSATTQVRDFHRLWSLKEAALKAQGLGLGAGMKQPSFQLRPALRCTRARSAEPWFFAAAELEHGKDRFAMAVATRQAAATIDLVALRPDGSNGAQRTALVVDWATAAYAP